MMIKNYNTFINENYDDTDEYDDIEDIEDYNKIYGEYDDDNIFYHGTTNKNLIGQNGIHVGTYVSAKQALNARIGIPATGDWDGTKQYGKTLISGNNKLKDIESNGIYCISGYNCGNDVPNENYYPTNRQTKARYSDNTIIPFDSYPNIFKVQIIGEMEEDIISDFKANDLGNNPYSSVGYYYINISEDEGSISAVVPTNKWLKILNK